MTTRNNGRAPLRGAAGGALAAALLILSAAPTATVAAGADVDRRLADCARLHEPSDRLACFDSIAADRAAAAPRPPSPPATDAVAAPAPGSRAGEPPAVAAPASAAEGAGVTDDASFGAEMLPRPEGDGRYRGPEQISAQLLRIDQQPRGERVFYLSNEQVWMELEAGRGHYRDGQTVTVRRAAFGGYMLQADGVRGARVRRVR